MENQNKKIANFQLIISENCSVIEKQTLQSYWEFKDEELVNTPKFVKEKFNITQSELRLLNWKHTSVSFYVFCEQCYSYEKHNTKSHYDYNYIIKKFNGHYYKAPKCNHCVEQEENMRKLEHNKKRKNIFEKLDEAIAKKNWLHLSSFEKGILKNCVKMDFNELKTHYGKILGTINFSKFIAALYNLERNHLLFLIKNSSNAYITNYICSVNLADVVDEIIVEKKKPTPSVEINSETNEIKMKLTVNEFQNHPDSPLYSGTVTFKESIVIEPHVEYIFGHWKRENNDLYLTLTPIENMDKLPVQKRLSSLPIRLQQAITDYLNNLGKSLDF